MGRGSCVCLFFRASVSGALTTNRPADFVYDVVLVCSDRLGKAKTLPVNVRVSFSPLLLLLGRAGTELKQAVF